MHVIAALLFVAAQDPVLDEKPPPQSSSSSSSSGGGVQLTGATDGPAPPGTVLGLGIAIGAPVGLAGKVNLPSSMAVSFILGAWSLEYAGLVLDFLWHPLPALATGPYGHPYLGIGGGTALGLGNVPGGRGIVAGRGMYNLVGFNRGPYLFYTPFGFAMDLHGTVSLGWTFQPAPMDLFVDFSPGVVVLPDLNLGTRLTVGGRWYL